MSTRGFLGRAWHRLTGGLQLERLAAVEEKVGKFGRGQREALAAQQQQIEQLSAQLRTRAGADAVRVLEHQLEQLQQSLVEQDRTVSNALERARLFDEQAVDDRRFARRIEAFRRHDRPIVVGPWTGEVGFELLYWIPFVRRTIARFGIDPARLTVVSRGGTARWYGTLADRYVDIFQLIGPDEFRAATEQAKKQRRVGAFDVAIADRVRQRDGLADAELLHPGMMYRLFNPFWKELAPVGRVEQYTDYARVGGREAGQNGDALSDLPAEYIAARFYFSDCFPDTDANRAFVASTIDSISRHTPVVLLNAPFTVDDHRDFIPQSGRVTSVAARMRPETNLDVQTAVIARARAFVGTYGGYSYLAPFLGTPALAFYSERNFKPHHLHLAQRVFERLGGATVTPLDVAAMPLVHLVSPATGVAVP